MTSLELDAGGASTGEQQGTLQGSLGTVGVLFAVLAYNGPLAVVVGFIPVIVSSGGLGGPGLFILGGILLTLFAVGFLAMGRHMTNPGAFYSYVAAGLGRPAGVAASFVAIFAYFFALLGALAFAGLSLPGFITGTLNGPSMTWWAAAFIYVAVVGLLGYFSIELSAKVLSILLTGELGIIVLSNLFIGAKVGPSHYDLNVFSPGDWSAGSFGLALLFVMLCFGGFEATAVFREEVKDPDRTIPRATYLTIGVIAVGFAVSTWMFINGFGDMHGFGVDKVVAGAGADPTGAAYANVQHYMGSFAVDATNLLLCTSIFAATLSCHNIVTRYLYNLGVDSVIPRHMGKVHARHGSPHLASLTVSAATVVAMLVLAIAVKEPSTLYASLTGVAGYAILLLLFATSVSVLVYLNRHRPESMGLGVRLVAPVLAIAGLGVSSYLATTNMGLLVASDTRGKFLIAAVALTALVGVGTGFYCRSRKPDVYAQIGRQ